MKFLIIGTVLFVFPLSVLAGTFLETFDGKDLDAWQQIWVDKGPAVWRVVDDELHAESRADFPDFQTGGVGFGLWNYTAIFDNITVTGDSVPNSGDFAVTPQEKLATTWGNLKRF